MPIQLIKKWGVFVLALLIGIGTIAYLLIDFNEEVADNTEAETKAYLSDIRDNGVYILNNEMERLQEALKNEARTLGRLGPISDEVLLAELSDFAKTTAVSKAFVMTFSGTVYSSYDGSVNRYNPALYKDSLYQKENGISQPRRSASTKQMVVDLSVPLSLNGQCVGILAVSYDIDAFKAILTNNFLDGNNVMCLTRSDGNLIARTDGFSAPADFSENIFDFYFREDVRFSMSNATEVKMGMEKGKAGFAVYTNQGTTRYVSYGPVGIKDWYLAAVSTDKIILEKTGAIEADALGLILGVVAVLLALLLSLVLLRTAEHKNHLQELSELAFVDSLTGAANKKKFMLDATKLISAGKERYAVVVLDVDKFKMLNDTLGYAKGDELLICMSNVMKQNLRTVETYGRNESDEFYMLLKYNGDENIKHRIDHMILQITKEFREQAGQVYTVVLSAGIYVVANKEESISVIGDRAKYAQQLIKGNQISSVAFYSEEVRQRLLEEKEIENKMHDALKKQEFMLYLQPKYKLCDQSICGAEALVRWGDVEKVVRYPDQFIPIFEKDGFITKMDMCMLEMTCRFLRSQLDKGIEAVPISINFSRQHLANATFVDEIARIVKQYEVPPHLIEIELTESTMLNNESVLIGVLSQLHRHGFTLSMDDFGSGYSSLGLLKNIPVDTLKLDRTFFTQYRDLERAKTVISNVIIMAKQLNIHTVAEGVETREHVDLLRELGCDVVQGYYYARPMEAQKFNLILSGRGEENER